MNEQLQGAVAKILERAISGIDSSVEFMQAELPDVIEQLLLWYGVKGLTECLIGMALFIIMIKIDLHAFKKMKDSSHFDSVEMLLFNGVCGSLLRCVYFYPISLMNIEWLQIWVAPKIWLMEYAAKLVN